MLLQYAVYGFFLPVLSHYLKNFLGFTPVQVGVIMAMPALAAILAPFVVVRIADRIVSAERLLAISHIVAAAIMIVLYYQDRYISWVALYLLYGLAFVPTFALTNAVAFHHVTDAKREFGGIRMWGPVSWVVVGWGFGYVWLRGGGTDLATSRLPQALVLAALTSVIMGAYALTLPVSKVKREQTKGLGLRDALSVFLRPDLLLLCGLTFFNALVHQLYYYGMGPFLSQIGFADSHIMPAMSMGQFGEVFVMLALGRCLAALGFKRVFLIGVLAQSVRCLVFAIGWKPLILVVIPSHGVCYACFFAAAYIYVDQNSSNENRAGAQQLFNILVAGLGNLAGNLVAGNVAEFFTAPDGVTIDFRSFWLVSVSISAAIALALALFFKETKAKPK